MGLDGVAHTGDLVTAEIVQDDDFPVPVRDRRNQPLSRRRDTAASYWWWPRSRR